MQRQPEMAFAQDAPVPAGDTAQAAHISGSHESGTHDTPRRNGSGSARSSAPREHLWQRAQPARGSELWTGSGLPLGKAIVERHGGSVGVEGVPGQGGATFWIALPLAGATDA